MKATGVSILIRGRYKPPGDSSTDEKPLHLHLEARTEEDMDRAESAIREIMGPPAPAATDVEPSQLLPPPPPSTFIPGQPTPSSSSQPRAPASSSAAPLFTCLLEAGVDPAAGYQVRGKLLGPKGSYLKHIQDQTGVRVQLRYVLDSGSPAPPALLSVAPDQRVPRHPSRLGVALRRLAAARVRVTSNPTATRPTIRYRSASTRRRRSSLMLLSSLRNI